MNEGEADRVLCDDFSNFISEVSGVQLNAEETDKKPSANIVDTV